MSESKEQISGIQSRFPLVPFAVVLYLSTLFAAWSALAVPFFYSSQENLLVALGLFCFSFVPAFLCAKRSPKVAYGMVAFDILLVLLLYLLAMGAVAGAIG